MAEENLQSFVNEILGLDPLRQLADTYKKSKSAIYGQAMAALGEYSPLDLGRGMLEEGVQVRYQIPLPDPSDPEERRSEAYTRRFRLRSALAGMESSIDSTQEIYRTEATARGVDPTPFESRDVIMKILDYAPVYYEAQEQMEEITSNLEEAYEPVREAIQGTAGEGEADP